MVDNGVQIWSTWGFTYSSECVFVESLLTSSTWFKIWEDFFGGEGYFDKHVQGYTLPVSQALLQLCEALPVLSVLQNVLATTTTTPHLTRGEMEAGRGLAQ